MDKIKSFFLKTMSFLINEINLILFKIQPPQIDTSNNSIKQNLFYHNIAQKRLPNYHVKNVEVLGFFYFNHEKLNDFISCYDKNQLMNFNYDKGDFNPYKDYACVLQVNVGSDSYIIIEVQYYDYLKKEEMVFCKMLRSDNADL